MARLKLDQRRSRGGGERTGREPCTARAATSDAVPSAVMNTSALTTSSTSAGTMTRLRPTRSDARPTVTRATSTATAYAEKT